MKRIFISFAAIFVLILNVAVPFKTFGVYNNMETDVTSFVNHYKSDFLDDAEKYIFFNFDIQNPDISTGCVIKFTSQNLNDGTFDFTNNILTINNSNASFFAINTYVSSYQNHNSNNIVFDFNTNIGYIYDEYNYKYNFNLNETAQNFNFYNFDSNLDVLPNNQVINVDVEFSPDLDGVVTRTETIDGKSYTSDNLQMTVTNNSSKKVQFFMSFVNVGQECTFPSVADNSTFEEYKKGFTNGSIYTYVTDEWLGISQSGISSALPNLSQNLGFSPSAWHTVQPNDTQVYNIPWSAMKLAKNEQYDVVVYACWNNVDLEGTNYSGVTVSGVTEAVDLFLNDVEEVYRSTFSISDPAKFDVNTEGVHAWDNDVDNSDYFNEVKAFTDEHGNLIIKDQYYDQNGNFVGGKGYNEKSNFESSSSTKNFRNSYNSFIGFVTYIFNRFPGDIKNIYYYSFLGICVLGIIKRVT